MSRRNALVTGASSGIGKAIALQLAAAGCAAFTLMDLDEKGMKETAEEVKKQAPGADVVCVKCDVSDAVQQKVAFEKHLARFDGLATVVLNAGIGERGTMLDPSNTFWQKTLDVDLTAVLVGVRLASAYMKGQGEILSVASAGAIFPMPAAPVYAAAKAGVVQFTRSAAGMLERRGIRLLTLCPMYVETPLVTVLKEKDPEAARQLLGSLEVKLLKPAYVADVAMKLITDPASYPGGSVVLIKQDGKVSLPYAATDAKLKQHREELQRRDRERDKQRQSAAGAGSANAGAAQAVRSQLAAWAGHALPASQRKVVVHALSPKFREATRVVSAPLLPLSALPPGKLLVRRVYAGINASDINYSAGRYHKSIQEARSQLPYDAGFESSNVVVAVGPGVTGIAPGDCVAAMSYGAFSEYGIEDAKQVLPLPTSSTSILSQQQQRITGLCPEVVALLTSGLTASIALEVDGRVQRGDVVLVTAAAGGTGQFAVQLAKAAGAHVVATCGGPEKAELLRRLGADRVVDYKRESLKAVLKAEYPGGVNVVYEGVGGDMFTTALDALAPRGRLIIIGMMTSYASGWSLSNHPGLAEKLLWKSASACGFFLLRHARLFRPHFQRLVAMWEAGRLEVAVDRRRRFVGVESVADAVEYLHSGESMGKVVVQMHADLPAAAAGGASPWSKL